MLVFGEKKIENPIKAIWRSFVFPFVSLKKYTVKFPLVFVSGNFCTPTLNKDSSNDNNNKNNSFISKNKSTQNFVKS